MKNVPIIMNKSIYNDHVLREYSYLKMEISELLQTEKFNFEQLIELQDKLANIDQISIDDITKIISSNFLKNKETMRQLLYSIKFAIEWRPKNFNKYCQLLELESKIIKDNFSSDELCVEILTNDFIRLRLYELGLIDIESLRKISTLNINSKDFFKPELMNDQIDIEKDKLRHEGMHENTLCQLIRSDDLIEFQHVLSISSVNINSCVTFSLFEISSINNDYLRMPRLIEYAAFYGSIQIFKYLVLNDAEITSRLPEFAVAGGNYEIIHILEDMELSFQKTFYYAIRFHRNEVADYLSTNHNIKLATYMLQTCVLYYNVEELVKLLCTNDDFQINAKDHGMTIFMFAAENGYLDLVKFFSMVKGININECNEVDVFLKKKLINFGMHFFCLLKTIMLKL